MPFWERVKAAIKDQNTTQAWVSEQVGVSHSMFRSWISREIMPNADQALAIAQALRTSVEWLVTGQHPANFVPPRLRPILDDLGLLTDQELEFLSRQVHGMVAGREYQERANAKTSN